MKKNPLPLLTLLTVCIILASCRNQTPQFDTFAKIDAHVHIRTGDPSFAEQALSDNFQLLTITTRSSSRESIDEQIHFAILQNKNFPNAVYFTTTFSMDDFNTPGWQDETIIRLKQDFDSGAIAVKVWKDIGMTFLDTDSSFIMIDDPRFDPVLDFIASAGKTLVAHIGEPRNCWLPLDSMTVNSDREYFSNHPEYHMYLHPDYPSYEDQIRSRDHMLEKHPDLKVVGAHLGSLEWNVDKIAACLDRYSNFAVDMSARICHFQVQEREKVRNFIVKYQDRILYGTDMGVSESSNISAATNRVHDVWLAHWRYFTTDETMFSEIVNKEFRGLKLDTEVLRKIYYENAMKWYPGLGE